MGGQPRGGVGSDSGTQCQSGTELSEHHSRSAPAPELAAVVGEAAGVNLDLEDLVKAGNARSFIFLRMLK